MTELKLDLAVLKEYRLCNEKLTKIIYPLPTSRFLAFCNKTAIGRYKDRANKWGNSN